MKYTKCWYKKVCDVYPDNCSEYCTQFALMHSLVALSNLPKSKWYSIPLIAGKDKRSFGRLYEIKKDIKNWVKDGNNLYLYSSNFGNGKTSWAIKLLLSYFDKIWRTSCFNRKGIFISVSEFIERSRQNISFPDTEFHTLCQDLVTCDLVVWDDISAVKLNNYGYDIFFNYVNRRCNAEKSNIFTGNFDEKALVENFGGKLFSRIWNTSEAIEFKEPDKRGIRS